MKSSYGVLAAAIALAACNNSAIAPGLRPVAPIGSGDRPDAIWATEQLRSAAVQLRARLTQGGAQAHLALRLRRDEVAQLYTSAAFERIHNAQVGHEAGEADPRWVHLRSLADTPLVGFCARGARIAQQNGPEGLRVPALLVDRLLIVGAERDVLWAAWIEGMILTEDGWRLSAAVPFANQVEDPRRDHADVQLWDCDLGQRPRRDTPLEASTTAGR
ncbi:MAG: hypothetical protein U0269_25550 [Polyangiales bacterium]